MAVWSDCAIATIASGIRFYGDPGKIGRVLGPAFVRKRLQPVGLAFGADAMDDDDEREVYEFTNIDSLGVEAFRSIYEKPNPGL